MATCVFEQSWIGKCKEPAGETGYCEKHASLKCCSCGAKATRDCEHTGIQLVCGAPLCDGCKHSAPDVNNPGWFNLGGGHKPNAEADAAWAAYYTAWERRQKERELAALDEKRNKLVRELSEVKATP